MKNLQKKIPRSLRNDFEDFLERSSAYEIAEYLRTQLEAEQEIPRERLLAALEKLTEILRPNPDSPLLVTFQPAFLLASAPGPRHDGPDILSPIIARKRDEMRD